MFYCLIVIGISFCIGVSNCHNLEFYEKCDFGCTAVWQYLYTPTLMKIPSLATETKTQIQDSGSRYLGFPTNAILANMKLQTRSGANRSRIGRDTLARMSQNYINYLALDVDY